MSDERLMDLVRFARHHLFNENLISNEEYAALVFDSENGKRVARLESYDEVRAKLRESETERERLQAENESLLTENESLGQQLADCCGMSVGVENTVLRAEIERLERELAEAREDTARMDSLAGCLRANFSWIEDGDRRIVELYCDDRDGVTGGDLRAALDAARQAGERKETK